MGPHLTQLRVPRVAGLPDADLLDADLPDADQLPRRILMRVMWASLLPVLLSAQHVADRDLLPQTMKQMSLQDAAAA